MMDVEGVETISLGHTVVQLRSIQFQTDPIALQVQFRKEQQIDRAQFAASGG
jgi:hypothetical protein